MGKMYFESMQCISYLFLPDSSDKVQYCLKKIDIIYMAVVSRQHMKSLSLSSTSLETMGGHSDICYLHVSTCQWLKFLVYLYIRFLYVVIGLPPCI